jgi:predicted outer membrane repeat protein
MRSWRGVAILGASALTACSSSGDSGAAARPDANGTPFDMIDCEVGPAWPDRAITWRARDNLIPALGDAGVYATRAAFTLWEEAGVGLTFEEASIADIEVGAFAGEHDSEGAELAFDGPGGVAGHAFDAGDALAPGAVHLDAGENWSDGPSYDSSVLDAQTVIAHEIGHSLGLCHVDDSSALMADAYHGRLERLGDADLQALLSLYPDDGGGDDGGSDTGDGDDGGDGGDDTGDNGDDTGDDGDDTGDGGSDTDCVDSDGDGYGVGPDCIGEDCDDTHPHKNESAYETTWLDGVDNDCDGVVDEYDAGGASAYTLEDALQTAASGDLNIIVAPGTYYPTVARSFATHDVSFTGASSSDVIVDLTGAGCLYTVNSGQLTLSGMTIRNGTGCGTDTEGGALAVLGGTLRLENCVASNNSADGGGVVRVDGGNLDIEGCSFTNNSSTLEGGAVYVDNSGTVSVRGAVFAENTSGDNGGAIFVEMGGGATIENAVFSDNVSGRKGGALHLENNNTVAFSTFVANTASSYYGAIYVGGTGVTVEHSVFYDHGTSRDVYVQSDFCMEWSLYTSLYNGSWDDCGNNLWGDTPQFYTYSADGTFNDDFRLLGGSPGSDDGEGSCTDSDGSRCDRGAYGGPYGSLVP